MCPLALPRLALPCLEFHSRSRCTTMCSKWESDERARTCVCNTHTHMHTHIYSLTHTHCTLVYPETSFPCRFLFPSVPFFLCPLPSLSHSAVLYLPWEYLPALFSAFVFRGILLLDSALVVFFFRSHLIPPSFSLSHIHTPVSYCFRQVLPNVCSISCCLLWGAAECGRLLIGYIGNWKL